MNNPSTIKLDPTSKLFIPSEHFVDSCLYCPNRHRINGCCYECYKIIHDNSEYTNISK